MIAAGAAKSQLNQFYQRCKSPLPRYDVKKAEGGFKCTIICPSVYTSEGSVELQLFSGKGATKKASEAVAAAEAVKFLQDQPLFAARKSFVESLWETTKRNLSDQVLASGFSALLAMLLEATILRDRPDFLVPHSMSDQGRLVPGLMGFGNEHCIDTL